MSSTNEIELVRGMPVEVSFGLSRVFGRVLGIEGGQVSVCTPGGSTVSSGLCWVQRLNAKTMPRLVEFEAYEETPYHGILQGAELEVASFWAPKETTIGRVMSEDEVRQAIASDILLAFRPKPNDLYVEIVGAERVEDGQILTVSRKWVPSVKIPIEDVVVYDEARRSLGLGEYEPSPGTNKNEAESLMSAIEKAIGAQEGDGFGRVEIRLNLGQLRRLAALIASST